jgi:outer membrane lipoprotein-sorting protein
MDDNEKYIEEFVKDIPLEDVNPEHRDALKAQLLNAFPRHRLQPTDRLVPTWRIMMRTPITKLAAAAAIVAVLWVGLHVTSRSSVAFADVVQSFLSVKTAAFKMTMAVEDAPAQAFDCLYAEPIRMRQTTTDGSTIVISDFEKGKIVTLMPARKQAVVIEMQNIPDEKLGQFNMFGEIRRRLEEAEAADDESVESLGQAQIAGVEAIGYRIRKPEVDMTLWADPRTNLPVELKYTTGPTTYTMTDIVFNVEIDDILFDQEIPADYTIRTMQMDASEPTEADLIEMFRLWAGHIDGNLPTTVDMNASTDFVRLQQMKMKDEGVEPSEERMIQLQQTVMKMARGWLFVQQLPADSDGHYAGQGVTFGDATTPIFWYRPQGSQTYRVIYGDMSVREVSAEELPQAPETEPVSEDVSDKEALVDTAMALGGDIPPENRSLVARMLSLSEKDLVAGLKTFAELTGGRYPASLEAKSTIKEVDALKTEALANVPEETKKQKIYNIFFATAYHDKLVREKKDVAYHGDIVRAADVDKVLVRWKTTGGKYRVIFGDLTARDVTADELKGLEGR